MRLVQHRRFPVAHFVLIDERVSATTTEHLVSVAHRCAELLAARCNGDARHFTLIHNGSGLARCPDPHVHIVCARTRFQKGLIYLFIGLKNIFNLAPARAR